MIIALVHDKKRSVDSIAVHSSKQQYADDDANAATPADGASRQPVWFQLVQGLPCAHASVRPGDGRTGTGTGRGPVAGRVPAGPATTGELRGETCSSVKAL